MSVTTNVTTPETGRAQAAQLPGTTLPPGNADFDVLTWDATNKVPKWIALRTLVPDAPVPDPSPPTQVVPPSVSILDSTVTEPDLGNTVIASFTVLLDKPGTSEIQLDWKTMDVTAVAGQDYVGGAGTLVLAPGETLKTISIQILSDTLAEVVEEFGVIITGLRGATAGKVVASGKIVPLSAPPVEPPPTPSTGAHVRLRDNRRVILRDGRPVVLR